MDALTLFGLFAVTLMLITSAFERRSHGFILAFAGACALASIYGFLQGAWPFGLVEGVWTLVALRRWRQKRVATNSATFICGGWDLAILGAIMCIGTHEIRGPDYYRANGALSVSFPRDDRG